MEMSHRSKWFDAIIKDTEASPVSYTHLDVYKRQALNLAVADVRMEAPIPGKPAVGIEVPNHKKTAVSIRSRCV